ncbi:MAG: cob(I)yrinic acid a,c-diamide adenosyltransferase [Oscillospiraceae bacterium]
MSNMNTGLVHLYVGDGKGKTTAAMGLALRALGSGKRVLIAQFLKGSPTGELEPLNRLGVAVIRTKDVKKFVFQMDEGERALTKKACEDCLAAVERGLAAGSYDLIVLDEVVDAVNCAMLTSEHLLQVIASRGASVEIVMTGRNPNDDITAVADYLTVMTALKHPYQRGIQSRKGIEY